MAPTAAQTSGLAPSEGTASTHVGHEVEHRPLVFGEPVDVALVA